MARARGPRKIGRYSNDFKVKAVRLSYIAGTQVQEIAHGLDIHPFMLSRWRKEYQEGKFVADRRVNKVMDDKVVSAQERLKALVQENAKLRLENDLLKKAIRFSSEKRQKSSSS
jgi:transposase